REAPGEDEGERPHGGGMAGGVGIVKERRAEEEVAVAAVAWPHAPEEVLERFGGDELEAHGQQRVIAPAADRKDGDEQADDDQAVEEEIAGDVFDGSGPSGGVEGAIPAEQGRVELEEGEQGDGPGDRRDDVGEPRACAAAGV